MGSGCCMGFRELFELAHGRGWTPAEERAFSALDQEGKNRCVKEFARRAVGVVTEDRVGTDGRVYTAFWMGASGSAGACERPGSAVPPGR